MNRLVGGGRGRAGQRVWLSTPPTYVSKPSLFFALYAHLFLVHPLNGMFHLSWKPGGVWNSLFKKTFLFREWSLWDSIRYAADDRWRECYKGNSRGGPLEDKTDLNSCPLPLAWSWAKLETGREQTPAASAAPGRSPSQVSDLHPNKLG